MAKPHLYLAPRFPILPLAPNSAILGRCGLARGRLFLSPLLLGVFPSHRSSYAGIVVAAVPCVPSGFCSPRLLLLFLPSHQAEIPEDPTSFSASFPLPLDCLPVVPALDNCPDNFHEVRVRQCASDGPLTAHPSSGDALISFRLIWRCNPLRCFVPTP